MQRVAHVHRSRFKVIQGRTGTSDTALCKFAAAELGGSSL